MFCKIMKMDLADKIFAQIKSVTKVVFDVAYIADLETVIYA